MIDLLKKISTEHFQGKVSQTFLINNLFFINSNLKHLQENAFLKDELVQLD